MLENKFPENQKERVLFPCVSQLRDLDYLGHSFFWDVCFYLLFNYHRNALKLNTPLAHLLQLH